MRITASDVSAAKKPRSSDGRCSREASDNLNRSETITFRYGDIEPPLFRFPYTDVALWPTTQTWRAPQPMSVAKYFARVKMVQ